MRLRAGLGNGQTEAVAVGPGPGGIPAKEAGEEMRKMLIRDAGTLVADGHRGLAIRTHQNPDGPAGRTVLDRVVDQVAKGMLQDPLVAALLA